MERLRVQTQIYIYIHMCIHIYAGFYKGFVWQLHPSRHEAEPGKCRLTGTLLGGSWVPLRAPLKGSIGTL